ncbi:MAG: hypothetical protein J2P26_13660, partial [Nocardiopsaceae bacterium]|nr:hypothetical protein [Nocardiopsaceae bacterium]
HETGPVNERGAGRMVLCTYPVEHMAARTPRVNPEPTWALYDALAEMAGVARPLRCADPRVSCAALRFGHQDLEVVSNLSAQQVPAGPIGVLGPYEVTAALSGSPVSGSPVSGRR